MNRRRLLRMLGLVTFLALFLAGGNLPLAGAGRAAGAQPGGPRPAEWVEPPALPEKAKEWSEDHSAPPGTTWLIESVDAPKMFSDMGDRSLALDTNDRPHIAYGQDHLYYAYYDGTKWQIETVDHASGVGVYTSLALDSGNHPHISYCLFAEDQPLQRTCKELKYAHYDGAQWQIETVDSEGDLGSDTSLALGSGDHPHISYYDETNGALKHAHYDGTRWQIETVDHASGVGMYTSLALDSGNHPHISYCLLTEDSWPSLRTCKELKHAHYDGTQWQIETVDSEGVVGQGNSLALDANDRPHISYRDSTNAALKYAYHNGTEWQTEVVDGFSGVGQYTSLALDSNDQPHISYGGAGLKYARYDGTVWYYETVDSGGDVGGWNSLALDSHDHPRISYHDDTNYHLKYARYDGAIWHVETVDSGAFAGGLTSLALDSGDLPHISYAGGGLKYARHDGTSWQTETVDSFGSVAGQTSLAVDSNNLPHISYITEFNTSYGLLKYARFDGSAWYTETVDSAGWMLCYTSLALDDSGLPHITYCEYQGYGWCGALGYAYYDGTAWQAETVDSDGWVGWDTSLDLDTAGRPHMSYYDSTNDRLKYAHYDGVEWQIETVDSTGDVGWYTSLALDANDQPHISYYDYTNGHLKYAHHDSTSWQIETVDSAGSSGQYNTSIGIDSAGLPHISYCLCEEDGWACDALRYAHYDGVEWQIETVDSEGSVGWSASLALDSSDLPHISYSDRTNGDLKYAHAICVGLEEVTINGPSRLPVGIDGLYTTAYAPITASRPLGFTWDNGFSGPTATYNWTVTGIRTVAVTATNACGQATDTFNVTVFCQPLEGVEIKGAAMLAIGQPWVYRAVPQPITASRPLAFTWDSGAAGPTALYSWTLTGTYALTVTATNVCGGVRQDSLQVEVIEEWPSRVYLPLVMRND